MSKKKSKKRYKNYVVLFVDDSASMQGLETNIQQTFVENVKSIQQNVKKTGQDTRLTVCTFGNGIKTPVFNVDPNTVDENFLENYRATGVGTPLFDAVGKHIDQFKALPDSGEPNVSFLFLVLTDGYDNTSPNYRGTIGNLIMSVQRTDRWTLAFLVPDQQNVDQLASLGIPYGNIRTWETTETGLEAAVQETTRGVGAYFAARSTGQTSVQNFYQTDMSAVSAKQVKTKLEDVTHEVRVLKVKKEQDVRSFVEEETRKPLLKGAAFYELTKDEKKIQAYKQFLVMERGKKTVYAGDAARRLIGLPVGQDVKVKPGNHANFRIFVQSTSTNRKLVRGTDVLYWSAVGTPFTEGPSAPVKRARSK